MNRCAVLLTVAIVVFLLVLSNCSPSEERLLEAKADVKAERTNQFNVYVWPRITRISPKERFDVILRVVNTTPKIQSFCVFNSSWYLHWETDNPCVRLVGYSPMNYGDFPVTKKLEPGEAYEQTIQMQVDLCDSLTLTSFKVGFTPLTNNKHSCSQVISARCRQDLFGQSQPSLLRPAQPHSSAEKQVAGKINVFLPEDHPEIYWSNQVVLGIKPAKRK